VLRANKYRNHYCGTLSQEDANKEVKLAGWVENIRDHGGVIFIDLRDEYGIVQLVGNDGNIFNNITKESTISVDGKVRLRKESEYNENIPTGKIEVVIDSLTVLGKCSNVLPFDIITSKEVSEEIRLKYRYLDLRNKKVHDNIKFRSEVLKFIRNKMDSLGFTEVQTPIISVSSPEGARDFIIPSRKFKGKFYALPQAPQIYKQLLMVSGFDKYYQIAPCFRDEDCRADRTLEFYQLDFEMSFATEEDVYEVGEEFFYSIFTNFSNKKVTPKHFPRISYKEAMLKYGTDKPDLRNPLEIIDISEIFIDSDFKPFRGATIRGIKVTGIANNSNSWFNDVVLYANSIGMPGIGYISVNEDMSFKGPIDKFLSENDRKLLIDKSNISSGDVLFFIADKKEKVAAKRAGMIRTYLGEKLNLIDKEQYAFCIVNDFPFYEYDEEEDKYVFNHNPFSMPQGGLEVLKKENMENILAYQYDIVCNGCEMSSGAVRNHDIEIMKEAFNLVGYNEEVVKNKFKSLYTAFQYGPPPHAGMAPGIDRILMLLRDESNLREVQVFPPNVSGADNMMGSPNEISEEQLREVHIKLR
jgi:aspartyl-tRNA synthetase